MWEVQMKYKKETGSMMCPLCERKEDTMEHVIECGWENEKMYDLKDEHTKEEWLDITKIYRENKRKREIESERLEENEKKKKKNQDTSSSRTAKRKWKEMIITEKKREK